MNLKAVIFDYGMVLTTPPVAESHQRLLDITGAPREVFEQHYWANRSAYDIGHLNGTTFFQKFSADSGIALTPEQVADLVFHDVAMWTQLNEPMLQWAQQIQDAGIKTAILSNMGEDILRYMRQEFAWLGRFDHHTWSCELGLIKPGPEIYQHCLNGLGVQPGEAIFIDDRAENTDAAAALGITAIPFTTPANLRSQLAALGLSSQLPPVPA